MQIPTWGICSNVFRRKDRKGKKVRKNRKDRMNDTGNNNTNNEPSCCCGKKTERSEEERKKLIHRLNRIEGQIRGIRNMVERDAYCTDILMQSAAVNAAVNAFNKELIANHIRGCVVRDIKDGNEEVLDELVATLQKLMK